MTTTPSYRYCIDPLTRSPKKVRIPKLEGNIRPTSRHSRIDGKGIERVRSHARSKSDLDLMTLMDKDFVNMSPFGVYFDRVAVINLPSRPDRLKSIKSEIAKLGIPEEVIEVPFAPIPADDGGFPSRGVYGNYLSHLGILRTALADGTRRLLVLEDDAIFSLAARNFLRQSKILQEVEGQEWSMWHLGHKLSFELKGLPKGTIPNAMEFHWAHAYAVHHDSLAELIAFLELSMGRPAGYGIGKMYIDGAFYHYRAEEASKPCLVSNPALSVQKGSDSSLAGPLSPGQMSLRRLPREIARKIRDEVWRWTNFHFR